MQIRVDNSLLKSLKENFIFQKRTGMTRGTPEPYVNRWKIGQDLTCSSSVMIEQYATIGEGNILYSIGSFSSSASMLPVGSQVGRYTEISNGLKTLGFRHPIEAVTINSSAFNFSRENVSTYIEKYNSEMGVDVNPVPVPTPQPHKKPILIGNDVWIGRDVTIKGGISIGDGAVIASGSMVTKNVPSYTIVGGTPAKFIKKRFSDEIASKLIESQWWNLELGDLYREQLDFSDPARFLAKLSKVKD
ncbi:CatB-related O-acetyltransferase, partial [Cobetia amphilecti]|uniref:CatB-related O-acetyltransferase n=1 Tax=Cobetia amphilecti TaxID=1055104 RepID=UPI000A04B70E